MSTTTPSEEVVGNLAEHSSACVVLDQSNANQLASASRIDPGPLISHVRQSFRTVRTIGNYEVMVRNERAGQIPD